MPPFEIDHLNSLKQFVGRELPPTDWFVVTQERIQKFADATEDRQWIHLDTQRAAAESPYKQTITHGFLTLSLLSFLVAQAIQVQQGVGVRINYGLDRVRFPSAVPSGSAISARVMLSSVKESSDFVDLVLSITIDRQGSDKPCCVADWIVRYYRA